MKIYKALVRIGGSRDHEVWKDNLTAAEMKMLEHIHNSPQGHPVLDKIEHTGNVNRKDSKERARLADLYAPGELSEDRGKDLVKQLFGLPGVPLPQEYEPPAPTVAEEYDAADEEEEVIEKVEEPVRTPISKRQRAKAETEDVL